MNSYLSQTPVTTVTFVRNIEEESDLPDIEGSACPDCGTTLEIGMLQDLLTEIRKRVLGSLWTGFKVLRVVDAQPWGTSTERSDGDLNGRTVDFWDGDYRVEQVRVCLEIVGDVAEKLAEMDGRSEITGGYLLGNQVFVRCEAPVAHGYAFGRVALGRVALGSDRFGLGDSCRAA